MEKKLTISHIAPYAPYQLMVQYTGILNGHELKEHAKNEPRADVFNDNGWKEWAEKWPAEVKGIKTGLVKEIKFYKNYSKVYVGTYHGWLKPLFPSMVKPILKPLSLYTDINSPAMNDLNCDLGEQIQINSLAWKAISYASLDWSAMEVCFRNHVDVFGLLDTGLAIEKGAEG